MAVVTSFPDFPELLSVRSHFLNSSESQVVFPSSGEKSHHCHNGDSKRGKSEYRMLWDFYRNQRKVTGDRPCVIDLAEVKEHVHAHTHAHIVNVNVNTSARCLQGFFPPPF